MIPSLQNLSTETMVWWGGGAAASGCADKKEVFSYSAHHAVALGPGIRPRRRKQTGLHGKRLISHLVPLYACRYLRTDCFYEIFSV
jgi:hypothetical protein